MREILDLGTFKKPGKSRSYRYAVFECPICKKHVEKVAKDGNKLSNLIVLSNSDHQKLHSYYSTICRRGKQ
jgi:hypothetical protein